MPSVFSDFSSKIRGLNVIQSGSKPPRLNLLVVAKDFDSKSIAAT